MNRCVGWIALLSLFACTPRPVAQEGGGPSIVGSAVPSASASTAVPKKVRVLSGDLAFLDAEDTPGQLTDGNAPPPLPGSNPAMHPFLTASCYGGRPELCSKARDLLMASKSYAEFLAKLRDAGFTVVDR